MLDLSIEGDIARITLFRPEARNAIDVASWRRLGLLAVQAQDSGARALIVSGQPGGTFSAGADLRDFRAFASDQAAREAFLDALRSGIDAIAGLTIPTIAMVEGACFGGAVALAIACDLRIAGRGARFAITPAKFGIGYPQEDVHRLISLVGPGHAARLLFSAEEIGADEALRIGLVEIVANDGEADARSLAARIVSSDPASLAMLKRGVRLATRGVASDDQQRAKFLDLLGSDRLARALRR